MAVKGQNMYLKAVSYTKLFLKSCIRLYYIIQLAVARNTIYTVNNLPYKILP